ncbi:uncharacterized protein K02A2.6-like [Anopheles arabiensis]|uniref:uncharacterized protein K02A2.6-like n=1 Tax=Anopheles arabiensis TaxID=7173 RepID=UPI001AAE0353|nr:uncharacterized protein K02A2.6-like [Anopheles arabiensis]
MNISGDEERRSSGVFNVQPSIAPHPSQNGSGEPPLQQPPLQMPPSPLTENSLMMQILQLMQQQMTQQQNILAQLMQHQGSGSGQNSLTSPEQILDSLCSHLKEFNYDAEAGSTFAAWYSRYEDLFEKDAARLSDEAKVRLLMRKLETLEHDRLPPGIKVAPAAFQQLMDKMLVGLRGVSSYMDDIIVGGRNQEEHDETQLQTLGRIQEYGFTIRVDKCSFNKSQIRYLGHIIDRNGISPDPSKVEAIINLPAPSDVSERMKSLARSYVYWTSIDSDISECVASCEKCQTAAKTPAHSPHVPWPKSSSPWQRVHIDYAGPVEGDYFLIIVDAYSKWPEVIKTSSTTASATIAILRGIFARFGIPVTLVSDNGTQFTSGIFADFCTSNGIQHLRTAPFHPQSNGQAERFVDTFKRAMKKICSDDTSLPEAIDLFLQTYRSTPNPAIDENKSPAEVMIGRQMRTCFDLLRPTAISNEPRVPDNMRVLHCGELVYVKTFYRNNWKWEPAIVTKRCGSVMYEVKTSFQRILRRHINQMRRRSVSFHQSNRPSQPMALDVLLGTWNVQPRTSPISSDVNQCTPLLSSVSSPNSKPASFASSPSSSPSSTLLSTSESASSTSSPSSSSSLYDSSSVYTSCSPPPEEESPVLLADNSSAKQLEDDNEGTQLVQAPRRSSRNKRPPRWLNQY